MNGIHDMGGMHGFGPIPYEKDEPVFHEAWEGRVFALRVPFLKNFRYAIECMDPTHYLTSGYSEKWLHVKIQDLIEQGTITQQELDERIAYYRANPQANPPRREDPEVIQHARYFLSILFPPARPQLFPLPPEDWAAVQRAEAGIYPPEWQRRDIDVPPAFQIGDEVRAKNMHPVGHTRLPRYVRGKKCVVVKYYGIRRFGDTVPPGMAAGPQHLYCVRFEAQEVWGASAEPNNAVYLDMWESYLVSA